MVIKVNVVIQQVRKKKVISFMNILKHQLHLVGKKVPHYHRIPLIRILIKVKIFFVIQLLFTVVI